MSSDEVNFDQDSDALKDSEVDPDASQESSDTLSNCLLSTPDSPPLKQEQDRSNEGSTPRRKRSYEQMAELSADVDEKPRADVQSGNGTPTQEQVPTAELEAAFAVLPSTPAHSMPPSPTSTMMNPTHKSSKPKKGRAGRQESWPAATPPARSTSTKQSEPSEEPFDNQDNFHPDQSSLGAPDEQIVAFDWKELEHRYHDEMTELHKREREIMDEFSGLCQYFNVWATTGARREVDRSFKRLKTQMTLVQHHEDELEQKRLHYVKVVDAFRSAYELLTK